MFYLCWVFFVYIYVHLTLNGLHHIILYGESALWLHVALTYHPSFTAIFCSLSLPLHGFERRLVGCEGLVLLYFCNSIRSTVYRSFCCVSHIFIPIWKFSVLFAVHYPKLLVCRKIKAWSKHINCYPMCVTYLFYHGIGGGSYIHGRVGSVIDSVSCYCLPRCESYWGQIRTSIVWHLPLYPAGVKPTGGRFIGVRRLSSWLEDVGLVCVACTRIDAQSLPSHHHYS